MSAARIAASARRRRPRIARLGAAAALGLAVGLAGCGDPSGGADEPAPAHAFPAGFLWGTAVAGFQVDFGCPTLGPAECDDPNSDWYVFVTDPELVASGATHIKGDPLARSPGLWETYEADLERAAGELHNGAFRLSLELSRLFPTAEAGQATSVEQLAALADPAAVARYRAVFARARALGIEPIVTLNHYTLPTWLHDAKGCHFGFETCGDRGWDDPERIIGFMGLYAAWAGQTFGDQVDWWATINEPFAVVLAGYLLPSASRTNPPAVYLKADAAIRVTFAMAEAHIAMYEGLHAFDGVDASGDGRAAMVGPVPNLADVVPNDPSSAADAVAAEHAHYLYNQLFLDAVVFGAFDRDLDGMAEEQRPEWAGSADYVGINYYSRLPVKANAGPIFGAKYPYFDFFPVVDDLWNPNPDGLERVVLDATERYELPILITENGTPFIDRPDAFETILAPHLLALHRAIQAGADVRGYCVWSLIDNYEWNHGMDLRFGMYTYDEQTKARVLRPAGAAYAEVARRNGL